MKLFLAIILSTLVLLSCSSNNQNYNYIKILTIGHTDSVNIYTKGLGLWNYLYYDPNNDSVILRVTQSIDPNVFKTYEGQFKNKYYADTISMLIAVLKQYKNGILVNPLPPNTNYDGPELFVEYNDINGSHYNSFIISENDTLNFFNEFFHRLELIPWNKKIINNNRIDGSEEVVNLLKGLGRYDSIVPPYIPLPCVKGINMKMLYGKWRTIGDKYNNANLDYWTNIIGKDNSWVMERVINGETKTAYSGKIVSIGKDHSIKVKSKDGITKLKILNLTANCLEYKHIQSNKIWRLDRMK